MSWQERKPTERLGSVAKLFGCQPVGRISRYDLLGRQKEAAAVFRVQVKGVQVEKRFNVLLVTRNGKESASESRKRAEKKVAQSEAC